MAICIILALLIVIGILLTIKDYWNAEVIGTILIFVCSVLLIIAIVTKIAHSYRVHANINSFTATKITVEHARNNGVDFENAAIQHKIIEANQWLAKKQYYNASMLGWWIPNEVDNLKPIR